MKISEFKPVVLDFAVMCPQDGIMHKAVAHIRYENESFWTTNVECHKSWECDECALCRATVRRMLDTDPDMEDGPMVPRL